MPGVGSWINGVNIANTPAYPPDGKCRTCSEPVTGIEMYSPTAPRLRPASQRINPAKAEGPYYVPCGHDAADAFGGRRGESRTSDGDSPAVRSDH